MNQESVSPSTQLSSVTQGDYLCTQVNAGSADAHRIQRLGICAGRPLGVLSVGDPMIIKVSGTCIGISRLLAEHVMVVEP